MHRTAPTLTTTGRVAAALALAAAAFLAGVTATLYQQGVRGLCAHEYSADCVWIGPWQGVKGGDIVINPARFDR